MYFYHLTPAMNANVPFYTDEHLKWDKPPMMVCPILIDLSVTLPLTI